MKYREFLEVFVIFVLQWCELMEEDEFCENLWRSMKFCERFVNFVWMIEEFYGFLWISMESMEFCEDDEVQGIGLVWSLCEIVWNVCEILHFVNFAAFGENAGFWGFSGGSENTGFWGFLAVLVKSVKYEEV
jgi:hypothetical protein